MTSRPVRSQARDRGPEVAGLPSLRMTPRWQVLLALVASACASDSVDGPGGGDITFIGGDAGTGCARPEQGCACSPEQPPIDCYPDPVVDDEGHMTCGRGTRYCRDGAWTACEGIESYVVRNAAALVTGPSECNPCDPTCAVSRDTPDDADLPGSSTNVDYNPTAGGIVIEPTMPPPLADSDGDGVPDVADECVGAGAIQTSPGVCASGTWFFHTLPYGGAPVSDPLPLMVQIRTADVYFLMDTTASMDGETANLRAGLTSGSYIAGCPGGIIGAIQCTIPDAWFGVGRHDDYPVSPYGSAASGDTVYTNMLDLQSTASAAQTAVNNLPAHWGDDGPESQGQALWAIATGGGLGPYLTARSGCASGRWGYPCFRPGTIPIVILMTDAPFHNGPNGYNYGFTAPALPADTFITGNDTQATAYDVGDVAARWVSFSGSTVGLADNVDASCMSDGSTGDVVFRFTLSDDTFIVLKTEGSDFDTGLVVLASDFSTTLGCHDDVSSTDRTSLLYGELPAGTYYAVVTGWSGREGNYRLTLGNGDALRGYPVSWADTVSAMNSRGIYVITINSGRNYPPIYGLSDANALADATASYSGGDGSRYVFNIPTDGSGLGTEIVDAIVDLARYTRMDITARAVDNTATAAVNETGFVASITAASFGPGTCSSVSGGTFYGCNPGTSVRFNVAFRNNFVMPTGVPQVFNFNIQVLGDGLYVLATIPVRIVVPPVALTYTSGTYWRDYDSTMFCAANERPDWGSLSWTIPSLPAGTSVRWEIRSADTETAVASASPVTFTVPSSTSPVDIGARLVAAGQPNYRSHLRVTAVLLSNADNSQTPVLRNFELTYTCQPIE
jgi:hypothetical protein